MYSFGGSRVFWGSFLGNHKPRRWSLQATNKLCIQWKLSVPHEKCWLHGILPPRLGTSGWEWVTYVYHSFRVMSNHVAVEGNSTAHHNPFTTSPNPLSKPTHPRFQVKASESSWVRKFWCIYIHKYIYILVCLLGLLHPKYLHVFFWMAIFGGELPYRNHDFGGDQPAGWMTGPSPWWPPQVPNVAHDASRHNAAVAFNDKGKPPNRFPRKTRETSPWWEKGVAEPLKRRFF